MTARKKRAVRVITVYSDGTTATVAANPARRKKAAKKKAVRPGRMDREIKPGDRRRRYEYVCKVKKGGGRYSSRKFWALNDQAAHRYANGLMLQKMPKGSYPASLQRTGRSRMGPAVKKKVTRAGA